MPPHQSSAAPEERRLILLGSTGSIGTQTLQVVTHLNSLHAQGLWPTRYRIVGLAAGSSTDSLFAQAAQFDVHNLALASPSSPSTSSHYHLRTGPTSAEQLIREVECDLVLAAMVGSAGLPATLAAVELGRDVALANKETLVAAGSLVIPAARASGCRLLPVDSEHSALWQSLQGPGPGICPPCTLDPDVARLILTASGGPFRTLSHHETYHASPAQALNHPVWKMGPKVTVDSASLMNKALEVIEAYWLFGLPPERIDVVIHPQSIIHSAVEFADGSLIAQLGASDMRTPIQYAITYPHRPPGISRKLDLATLAKLDFAPPDHQRFPALGLAYRAIRSGGTAGAILNAANEVAVELFLAGHIPFGRIPELVESTMNSLGSSPAPSLADILAADAHARAAARSLASVSTRPSPSSLVPNA